MSEQNELREILDGAIRNHMTITGKYGVEQQIIDLFKKMAHECVPEVMHIKLKYDKRFDIGREFGHNVCRGKAHENIEKKFTRRDK